MTKAMLLSLLENVDDEEDITLYSAEGSEVGDNLKVLSFEREVDEDGEITEGIILNLGIL